MTANKDTHFSILTMLLEYESMYCYQLMAESNRTIQPCIRFHPVTSKSLCINHCKKYIQ